MIIFDFQTIINFLNNVDPSPLFVISLFPYIIFLFYLQKIELIPKISLWGFRLTLLFVLMTIIFAIISIIYFKQELTNVDTLHGAAESFLTLSDALIVLGLFNVLQKKHVNNS
tara:strand:+ start:3371 stop:3709 length:339 start_codon:yes stop_codon:yes gene_type:complete